MTPALLIGREPGQELGYCYVTEPPYEAVVIGSLSLGQLLRFREERVLEALCRASSGRTVLASAQRELKNWGVLFTDGGRKRLVTAEEARRLRQRGERPGFDAVLTPLAKEILEGNH